MTVSFDGTLLAPHYNPPPQESVAAFPVRELAKGEALYQPGDLADTVYQVEGGLLKVSIDVLTGKERIVSVAGPGDFVGALTPQQIAFQDRAEALSPRVQVRVMPRNRLPQDVLEAVHAAAGVQLARLRDTLEDSELPVTARLARTLLRLGQRFGHTAEDGTVRLTLPLTHENFAAMIGAARETTTAILGEMRSSGLINGTRGQYAFDREKLRAFALDAALS